MNSLNKNGSNINPCEILQVTSLATYTKDQPLLCVFQLGRQTYIFDKFIKFTAQKTKFFIKDIFSKCDQICRELQVLKHLLKISLMEKFIFVQWLVPFKPE